MVPLSTRSGYRLRYGSTRGPHGASQGESPCSGLHGRRGGRVPDTDDGGPTASPRAVPVQPEPVRPAPVDRRPGRRPSSWSSRSSAWSAPAASPSRWPWLALAALVVFGELRPVVTSRSYGEGTTPSIAFTFAIMFLWGPWPAILAQALASLVADLTARKSWWRVMVNPAQYALSFFLAWTALDLYGYTRRPGGDPHGDRRRPGPDGAGLDRLLRRQQLHRLRACWPRTPARPFRSVFLEDFGYLLVLQLLRAGDLAAGRGGGPDQRVVAAAAAPPLFAVYRTSAMSLEKEHQANHDALTGLPNRKYLLEALDQRARRGGAGPAGRAVPARPGPVQGGQRHPRAPDRRPPARARRRADPRRAAARGRGGPPGRRRVRRAAADASRTPRRRPRWRCGSRPRSPSRSGSRGCCSSWRPAWASRCTRTTAPTCSSCSARPTSRCTWRRRSAPASRSTPPTRTATPRPGWGCSARCARGSTGGSSSCTTSRRCRWRPAPSSASRRWYAGGTRTAA